MQIWSWPEVIKVRESLAKYQQLMKRLPQMFCHWDSNEWEVRDIQHSVAQAEQQWALDPNQNHNTEDCGGRVTRATAGIIQWFSFRRGTGLREGGKGGSNGTKDICQHLKTFLAVSTKKVSVLVVLVDRSQDAAEHL